MAKRTFGTGKDWVDDVQASRLLGVHRSTIARWASKGNLTFRKEDGRRVFSRQEIEQRKGRQANSPPLPDKGMRPTEAARLLGLKTANEVAAVAKQAGIKTWRVGGRKVRRYSAADVGKARTHSSYVSAKTAAESLGMTPEEFARKAPGLGIQRIGKTEPRYRIGDLRRVREAPSLPKLLNVKKKR